MKKSEIEIQRNNVTVAEFLNYVKKRCEGRGLDFGINKDDFENPNKEYLSSYRLFNGKKKVLYMEYENDKTISGCRLVAYENEYETKDIPCYGELFRHFAYDYQICVRDLDGTSFNEICEFTFYDEKKGYGFYYQENIY